MMGYRVLYRTCPFPLFGLGNCFILFDHQWPQRLLNRNREVGLLEDEQKTRVSVDIFGQTYTIVGDESSSHVRLVASMVDDKMREISARNPYLDSAKIAVLTAVNSVHDYLLLKEKIERLEEELNKLKG